MEKDTEEGSGPGRHSDIQVLPIMWLGHLLGPLSPQLDPLYPADERRVQSRLGGML